MEVTGPIQERGFPVSCDMYHTRKLQAYIYCFRNHPMTRGTSADVGAEEFQAE
jgi:hypothetical protein